MNQIDLYTAKSNKVYTSSLYSRAGSVSLYEVDN